MQISSKQAEYIVNATHKYNGRIAARRCGKTYLDIAYTIPSRILERKGKDGSIVLCGVAQSTLNRNILDPMRARYGSDLVSDIRHSDSTVKIFGEKCDIICAENARQVSKFRGTTIKYLYVDELVDVNKEVFDTAKASLSLPYSVCDFTGNPKFPGHWAYDFIYNSSSDVYCQSLTLYDNPFLDPVILRDIENDYRGSVLFDRYVLGEWKAAEGVIYKLFADDTESYLTDKLDPAELIYVSIGLDYGASKGKTAFIATGFTLGYKKCYILDEYVIDKTDNPEILYSSFRDFYLRVKASYGKAQFLYADWGGLGSILTGGLEKYARRNGYVISIRDCEKGEIIDRINLMSLLFAQNRIFILHKCKQTIQALKSAVWSDKKQDTRLDNNDLTADINDAVEYAVFPFSEYLIKTQGVSR